MRSASAAHTGASAGGRADAVAGGAAATTRRSLLLAALALPSAAPVGAEPSPRPWPADRVTPALELPAWEGKPFRLVDARGQLVVLNFWASWCEPCREEMPTLELLAERYASDRVVVQAINFRETDGAIARYLTQWPITLPILRDRDGAAALAFGVRVFPTTVAIDRRGRAAFSVTGAVDWGDAQARRWIAALL